MPEPLLPLTDSDLRQLAHLLARYAANHLDQWDLLLLEMPGGPVEVRIAVAEEASPSAQKVWPALEYPS